MNVSQIRGHQSPVPNTMRVRISSTPCARVLRPFPYTYISPVSLSSKIGRDMTRCARGERGKKKTSRASLAAERAGEVLKEGGISLAGKRGAAYG